MPKTELKPAIRCEQMRGDKFICKCECGGDVRGIQQNGMTFSYCDRCTPVVPLQISEVRAKGARDGRA